MSSSAAHKLVRWAARHRYADQALAAQMAEDQSALINDIPGNLVKLAFAVHFSLAAIAWRVGVHWTASRETNRAIQSALRINIWFAAPMCDDWRRLPAKVRTARLDEAQNAWDSLEGEIRRTATTAGVTGWSLRTILKRLTQPVDDVLKAALIKEVKTLKSYQRSFYEPRWIQHGKGVLGHMSARIPTQHFLDEYIAATAVLGEEVRNLTTSQQASLAQQHHKQNRDLVHRPPCQQPPSRRHST